MLLFFFKFAGKEHREDREVIIVQFCCAGPAHKLQSQQGILDDYLFGFKKGLLVLELFSPKQPETPLLFYQQCDLYIWAISNIQLIHEQCEF